MSKPHRYKTCSGWGNAIGWLNPEQFSKDHDKTTLFDVHGHQRRIPKLMDLLEAEFEKSHRVFRFVVVRPCGDPRDMFFAKVQCIEVTPK